jgi:hypothetical protein
MIENQEDAVIDLDSSSSLELDRRMIVQESTETVHEAELGRCDAGRHLCHTERREILQQPFQSSEFRR